MKTFIIASIMTVLIAVIGIVYFGDEGLTTSREELSASNNKLINSQTLAIEGIAPPLQGIKGWINLSDSKQTLEQEDLRGKVVLVDFWTYSCINCIRTFPHLSSWYEKYKDNNFLLIGVHTPEFNFEKDRNNILGAIEKYNINYPVALDNDYETWNAFRNQYWPASYLIDVNGNVRYRHFGEGSYDKTEAAIQQLLLEASYLELDDILDIATTPRVNTSGVATPEIYFGYKRINNFGNLEKDIPLEKVFTFSRPEIIAPNNFYLVGDWSIGEEQATFLGGEGKIIIHYKASKVNMVLRSNKNIANIVELRLDGNYLTDETKGSDVVLGKNKSFSTIQEPQLYNFVDTGDNYDWHILEIILTEPNLEAFTFTFG